MGSVSQLVRVMIPIEINLVGHIYYFTLKVLMINVASVLRILVIVNTGVYDRHNDFRSSQGNSPGPVGLNNVMIPLVITMSGV